MNQQKQIEQRLELSDVINHAIRDWEDYTEECRKKGICPIDTFEEYIADFVFGAGYRKQSDTALEIIETIKKAIPGCQTRDHFPVDDVVEVVRCKDCGFRDKTMRCQCDSSYKGLIRKDNEFCSYGIVKE